MAYQRVSECCKSRYTEEPSEYDGVNHTTVCATCGRPCKITVIGEPDGKPRTAAQAYNDSFDENGNLRPEADPESSTVMGDAPRPDNSVTIKDGKIYQGGKLIGTAVDDKTWFKQEFGEDWQGSEEALTKIRNR